MSELREAVNMVVELRGKGAVLTELQVQRIIAQSESEASQEHVAKLDRLIAELEAADAMTLSVGSGVCLEG
jgi:copper homeostasis protein CutC